MSYAAIGPVLRSAAATVCAVAALIVPGAALMALTLVALVYLSAAALFAASAALLTQRSEDRRRLLREDLADLQSGAIAQMWPVVTVFGFLALLIA